MAQNPMVAEVNRLIANLLAAGEQIVFPEVGTLKPTTRPAQRLSRRKVLPPLHEVTFVAEERGVTLAERLVQAAGCTKEQADDIYTRWLAQTWQEQVLTLEGIGTLRNSQFTLDEVFEKRLNPQGREAIVVRRRRFGFDWMMAIGVVAIILAVGIGWYGYQELKGSVKMPWERDEATVATAETVAIPQQDTVAVLATTAVAQEQATMTNTTNTPTTAPVAATAVTTGGVPTVERMTSGHYYVVLGVFSTPENAARAVREAAAKSSTATCRIYYFGEKWMVSSFTSADAAEASRFRKESAAYFPETWVYRAR